jgi:hypothetical protein
MLDVTTPLEASIATPEQTPEPVQASAAETQAPLWETPKLEDVSEQVMAQPYIRFT